MNQLSKQALDYHEAAAGAVGGLVEDAPSDLSDDQITHLIALSQATATLALVQATEAQTKAIDQQTAAILKTGGRR